MSGRAGVIYIQRDKFQIYSPLMASVLEFRFVPEMIRDLDVINKELLEGVLKIFIEQNKIPVGNLVVFLADNVAFVKDFKLPDTSSSDQKSGEEGSVDKAKKAMLEKEVKDYIELTPFEEVASKRFVIENGVRVFITNKDLYLSIKEAFEKEGFAVDMVIPGLLLGNNISAQPTLTPQIAEFVLQHVSTLKQNNLLVKDIVQEEFKEEPEKEENNFDVKEEKVKPKTNKRLFLLIGVFALLIIALVVVYFTVGV
jgi:hypothetical protein